jgi:hypothetical protein
VVKSKRTLKEFVYSIMGMIWSRDILCSHSITGKASNAFKDKDAKPQLDSEKVKSLCGKLLLSLLLASISLFILLHPNMNSKLITLVTNFLASML